ncbi:hypothetical protein F5Y06DRAFT_267813 [Hypoxylon sp. FL0890]|nr:hypothetical protein F5Y06DRAFT_267813 [Hypoxylon sp. FL0890]
MATIPDSWFDQKVRDEIATVEQSTAMKAYLGGKIQADEAARLVTVGVHEAAEAETGEAEGLDEKLCELWGFIIDFILEWPSSHAMIIDLLYAISKIPHVDRTEKDSLETLTDDAGAERESQLWEDLPRFWNSLSEYWASEAAWRMEWARYDLERGERPSWFNINAFGAYAFKSGPFMGRRLLRDWGCYVLKEAADPKRELLDVDIPVAQVWMQMAGPELHYFFSTQFKGQSLPDTWLEWQKAFQDISNDDILDSAIRKKAADVAAAMGRASVISEGEHFENLRIDLTYV